MVPTTDSSSHLASKSYLVFELGHKMGNSSPLSSSLHSARNRGWDLLKRKFSIHRIHHDRSVIFHFTYPFSFFSCLGGFVYFFFFYFFFSFFFVFPFGSPLKLVRWRASELFVLANGGSEKSKIHGPRP